MSDTINDPNVGIGTENEKDNADLSGSVEINSADFSAKCWIEVLPSNIGALLIAVLANIMSEGLSPSQQNILGNFVAALGASILYKASRDELNVI